MTTSVDPFLYTEARMELPEENRLVKVLPPGSSTSFYATRSGRKWEIIFWIADDWCSFKTLIKGNEWWAYMKQEIEK